MTNSRYCCRAVLRKSFLPAIAAILMAACGSPQAVPDVATNPVTSGQGSAAPTAGQSPAATGVRTVLSPLGINIHADHQLNAAVLGTAAEGVALAVLAHTDEGGGWYRVQGQTVTGWIVANPALTADGQFRAYQSSERGFSVLYPETWTFADEPADVLFHPTSGVQSIVVRNAAHAADFGPTGATGFVGSGEQTVVVCGVTANLDLFTHTGASAPTPSPGTAGPLALLAQIRMTLDGSHALALDFNYTGSNDLAIFNDFYNSMTFPFPQCEAPPATAPSPSPSPT